MSDSPLRSVASVSQPDLVSSNCLKVRFATGVKENLQASN
jgi:hypothetical protein